MTKYSKAEIEESRKSLLEDLKPGDTVYTKVNHVSRSGMSRNIEVYIFKNNQPFYLSYDAARVLGWGQAKDGSVKVGGCGMDMGFHLVYSLSYRLFPEYKCTGDGCMSPVHINQPTTPRDGITIHEDGYALKQRWL